MANANGISLLSKLVGARFVDGLTKQHDAKEAEMKDALKRLKERGSEVVESERYLFMNVYDVLYLVFHSHYIIL